MERRNGVHPPRPGSNGPDRVLYGRTPWTSHKDKIAKQYQVPVRHIHDVLRTEIPVFDNIEDEKKFNEISQKKFIMTSTHQNLTNVFSQFKVVKK